MTRSANYNVLRNKINKCFNSGQHHHQRALIWSGSRQVSGTQGGKSQHGDSDGWPPWLKIESRRGSWRVLHCDLGPQVSGYSSMQRSSLKKEIRGPISKPQPRQKVGDHVRDERGQTWSVRLYWSLILGTLVANQLRWWVWAFRFILRPSSLLKKRRQENIEGKDKRTNPLITYYTELLVFMWAWRSHQSWNLTPHWD